MKKRPIIIDCDPGVDDALAIILAAKKSKFEIKAITSVSGNVGIEHTTENAKIIAGLLDLDVKIGRGSEKPLIETPIRAKMTHGLDGLAGESENYRYKIKEESNEDAVSMIARILRESEEKISIIAIGPLTNIAKVLLIYPELKEKIEAISIMGGSTTVGNVTEKAEFNFRVDPHAAHIVLNANVPIILSGLNVTLTAYFKNEELEFIKRKNTELSNFSYKIIKAYKSEDPAIHDPVAVLALSNPEIMQFKDLNVNVEYFGKYSSGMSFTDERKNKNVKPNCRIVESIDRDKFAREILNCF